MPSNSSIGQKIMQLAGLLKTRDLDDWENTFIDNIVRRSHQGVSTANLTAKQVDKIEQIYEKHFA